MAARRSFQSRKRELRAPKVDTAPTPCSCTDPTVEKVLEELSGSDGAPLSGSTETAVSGSLAAADNGSYAAALSGSSTFSSAGAAAASSTFFAACSTCESGCFSAGAAGSGSDSEV